MSYTKHKERRTKFELHGMHDTREYCSWARMIQRCINTSDPRYKRDYQDRGITVAPEFLNSFTAFYQEVGPCPGPEYSLDRIRNDEGYIHGNLKWSTRTQQQRNRSDFNQIVKYYGKEYLICQLAEKYGICQKLLRMRLLVYGWPIRKALEKTNFHSGKDLKNNPSKY